MSFELPNKELQPQKDMRKVADYNMERRLEILRGQCLNISSTLMASLNLENKPIENVIKDLFNLAQKLFDEAIEREYLSYNGKEK